MSRIAPQPILAHMPEHFKEKMIALLDTQSRTAIEQTSFEFRKLSRGIPRLFRKITLKIQEDARMQVIVQPEQTVEVERSAQIVNAMEFFRTLVTHRDTAIRELIISKECENESPSLELFYNNFLSTVSSLGHQLNVEAVEIGCYKARMAEILGVFDPEALKSIFPNFFDESDEIEVGEIAETEQWKKAIAIICHQPLLWHFNTFSHFELVHLNVSRDINVDMVAELIEFYKNNKTDLEQYIEIVGPDDLYNEALEAKFGVAERTEKKLGEGLFFAHSMFSIMFYNEIAKKKFNIRYPDEDAQSDSESDEEEDQDEDDEQDAVLNGNGVPVENGHGGEL